MFEVEYADIFGLLLRGGAMTISIVIAIQFIVRVEESLTRYFGVFYFLGIAVFFVNTAPIFQTNFPNITFYISIFYSMNVVAIWLFFKTLFVENFKFRRIYFYPIIAYTIFVIGALASRGQLREIFSFCQYLMVAGIAIHMIIFVLRDYKHDLVDSRRRFRIIMAVLIGGATILTALIQLMDFFKTVPKWIAYEAPISYFITGIIFASLALVPNPKLTPRRITTHNLTNRISHMEQAEEQQRETVASANAPDDGISVADRLELAKLKKIMEEGAYRQPGISMAELASAIHMPEHRLRGLINQGLGHRNLHAFLNDYRIEEAKEQLANPELARKQILEIAFDVGFASIAPFNRAFKERENISPRDYRRQNMGQEIEQETDETA